jgi:hypothetical protein
MASLARDIIKRPVLIGIYADGTVQIGDKYLNEHGAFIIGGADNHDQAERMLSELCENISGTYVLRGYADNGGIPVADRSFSFGALITQFEDAYQRHSR